MGIVKIADDLHEEVRKASAVMERSINAQAAFWIRVGMLAEANPNKTYSQLIDQQMQAAQVQVRPVASG